MLSRYKQVRTDWDTLHLGVVLYNENKIEIGEYGNSKCWILLYFLKKKFSVICAFANWLMFELNRKQQKFQSYRKICSRIIFIRFRVHCTKEFNIKECSFLVRIRGVINHRSYRGLQINVSMISIITVGSYPFKLSDEFTKCHTTEYYEQRRFRRLIYQKMTLISDSSDERTRIWKYFVPSSNRPMLLSYYTPPWCWWYIPHSSLCPGARCASTSSSLHSLGYISLRSSRIVRILSRPANEALRAVFIRGFSQGTLSFFPQLDIAGLTLDLKY